MASMLQHRLLDTSTTVYILIMLFAISSWIDINGLWVEMPLMVNVLPEGWALPAYIVIITQIGNIGPILYGLFKRLLGDRLQEWHATYVIIGVGALSCFLLIFFWDATSYIGGELHSTGLFVLNCFLALVDCTSSVVYLPYMQIFKQQYMSAFYVGEGLSGLLPAVVGLIQGVGQLDCVNTTIIRTNETTGLNTTSQEIVPVYMEPRFSVEVFFSFLVVMMITSGIAFTFVNFHPVCIKERDSASASDTPSVDLVAFNTIHSSQNTIGLTPNGSTTELLPDSKTHNVTNHVPSLPSTANGDKSVDLNDQLAAPSFPLPSTHFVWYLTLIFWINALTNGILPSTQSYSCLPYGQQAYNLANRLSAAANPLACFFALFVTTSSIGVITVLTIIASLMAAYELVLAGMSPNPPLQGEAIGTFLVVSTELWHLIFIFHLVIAHSPWIIFVSDILCIIILSRPIVA